MKRILSILLTIVMLLSMVTISYAADETIAAANPGVDMRFVNFNHVKFNRSGEFVYEMEDGAHAYYMFDDGKYYEIPNAYDASEEAFVFNTNVLANYVFANAELVIPA